MVSSHETVRVQLGQRSYNIDVGQGLLDGLGQLVGELDGISRALIITDTNVGPLYGDTVFESLQAAEVTTHRLTIEAGESSKCVDTANRLWQQALAAGTDRQAVVVALGGGVVGDLAGFIAATFGRGIRLVQVPTTLLAQVDSSVGGKVGINLPGAKNIVGCFWQPTHVMIDLSVLASLPDRQFAAGMAEVVKYGVIRDLELFEQLEAHASQLNQRNTDALAKIVARCCQIKAEVVAADEREETGLRAILNYGHTFGHALESITGYHQFLHGEAIAIGMTCAIQLAARLGMVPTKLAQRQTELLTNLNLPTTMPKCDSDEFLQIMRRDKKVVREHLRLVLPDKLGNVVLRGTTCRPPISWLS